MIKSNRGITLVALIVTIIVLTILAGITIRMAVGGNGIVDTVKDGTKKAEISTEIEQLNTIVTQSLNDAVIDGYGSVITMRNLYNATKDVNGYNNDGTLKVSIQKNEDGSINFVFKDSLRMYTISKEGSVDENYKTVQSLDEINDNFKDITNVEMIQE